MNIPSSLTDWLDWQRLDQVAELGINLLVNLIAALLIFWIGKWLTNKVVRLAKLAMTRAHVDDTLVGFVGNVLHAGLLVLVLMTALNKLGIPTTSAAALVGGAGLAIGLSLKDQLSNFAAGALIILFQPFKEGDYIKVNGYEGFVLEIRIVQTSLRTYANEEVILPNSVLMTGSIVNLSSLGLWRSQVIAGVDYASDLKLAKEAILRAATEHPLCSKEKPPTVQVTGLGDSAINITLWAWSTEADWWTFQCDLYERVVANLNAAGISMPFPTQSILVSQQVPTPPQGSSPPAPGATA